MEKNVNQDTEVVSLDGKQELSRVRSHEKRKSQILELCPMLQFIQCTGVVSLVVDYTGVVFFVVDYTRAVTLAVVYTGVKSFAVN